MVVLLEDEDEDDKDKCCCWKSFGQRVKQCAVGFHGDAVAADQRHVAVQHIVAAVYESHEVGLEGEVGAAADASSSSVEGRRMC